MVGRGAVCTRSLLPILSTRLASFRRISHRAVRMASPDSTATPSSSSASAGGSASSAVDFLSLCHRLKTTKRAGWVRRGVREPESVADHMYRMGVMSLVFDDIPGIDRNRCIKMALVHDIAEAIVGDITPSDGVPKLEKSRMEHEALDHMCKLLGGGSRANEISELWMEYEANSSPEAKLVKDFDKVEMILQALEYETEQGIDLEEFFESTADVKNTESEACTIRNQVVNDLEKLHELFSATKPFTNGKFQTDVGKAWASEIASRKKRLK